MVSLVGQGLMMVETQLKARGFHHSLEVRQEVENSRRRRSLNLEMKMEEEARMQVLMRQDWNVESQAYVPTRRSTSYPVGLLKEEKEEYFGDPRIDDQVGSMRVVEQHSDACDTFHDSNIAELCIHVHGMVKTSSPRRRRKREHSEKRHYHHGGFHKKNVEGFHIQFEDIPQSPVVVVVDEGEAPVQDERFDGISEQKVSKKKFVEVAGQMTLGG
jgi:hypothetical protein